MTHTMIDPSLHCQLGDGQHVGINGNYVDDLLRVGTDNCKIHSNATLERSETTGNQQEPFSFALMHINESDNVYHIDQDLHMNKIEQIPSDAEFSKFPSMRMKLAWLPYTGPDIAPEISQIARVTRSKYASR